MRRFSTKVGWLVLLLFFSSSFSARADSFRRGHRFFGAAPSVAGMTDGAAEEKMAATAKAFLRSLVSARGIAAESQFSNPKISRVAKRSCRRYEQMFRQKVILGAGAWICFDETGEVEETASSICAGDCSERAIEGVPLDPGDLLQRAEKGVALGSLRPDTASIRSIWVGEPEGVGIEGAYAVDFETTDPYGKFTVYLSGRTGELLAYENHLFDAEGKGAVFYRDPVTTSARVDVDLKNLLTLHTLETSHFKVENEDTVEAWSMDGSFFYPLTDTHFDEVQAFFGMQHGLRMLKDWGFSPSRKLKIVVHYGENYANAFFDGGRIALGDGDGKHLLSLARDNTVIIHETGHWVVQDLSPIRSNKMYGDGGALHEGYADYLACAAYGKPKLGEGIMVRAGEILRSCQVRVPFSDREKEVHEAGQVWSGALWEARETVGAWMDPIVIQSLHRIQPTGRMGSVTMNDAYRGILSATEVLIEGGDRVKVLGAIRRVFEGRGFEEDGKELAEELD